MSRVEITEDLEVCRALRRAVFIDEQGISERDEWDGRDGEAVHLVVRDAGVPVGTARLLRDGTRAVLGRICVLKTHRGRGFGANLVRFACDHVRAEGGGGALVLGAQQSAIGFYERLGFEAFGPIYDDAGIAHRKMRIGL